ncbi:hypothetical protein GXW83_28710 [Streptacidiphilus sp. PB12-B1b]|uniref:DUF6528 family protein n=1 Tax=Streptacidiphilus sp. PB12-B1b TaxID=2705012 RepID=UPI0015FA8673|nr:DUF6528 family protein [Streptacidiphilus sp. PB12-B1b]QMU79099.1 hypothetical protein GXW83_28710 [Streptacidiphilus sp. PB12-B1b]
MRLASAYRPDRRALLRGGVAAAAGLAATAARPARAEAAPRSAGGTLVIAADQASRSVVLLEPEAVARRSLAGAQWVWTPGGSLDDLRPEESWHLVSEAKWTRLYGSPAVAACASEGLVVVAGFPDGEVYWATVVPGANPHSVELLPDGGVAVAASDGGWVRLYAAALGPRSTRCAEYLLPGAHGVHWDAGTGLLWAVGGSVLVALACNRSRLYPQLSEVARFPLPGYGGGHDLGPVAGDPDRLWVTTDGHVLQFSVPDAAFVPFPEQARVDHPSVKSIGDDPATGQILLVTPSLDNPCVWCTSTVELVDPDGVETFPGAALYKARWAIGRA